MWSFRYLLGIISVVIVVFLLTVEFAILPQKQMADSMIYHQLREKKKILKSKASSTTVETIIKKTTTQQMSRENLTPTNTSVKSYTKPKTKTRVVRCQVFVMRQTFFGVFLL